jgi:hypothetical protein
MKLTKQQLKQIIKEELEKVIAELAPRSEQVPAEYKDRPDCQQAWLAADAWELSGGGMYGYVPDDKFEKEYGMSGRQYLQKKCS